MERNGERSSSERQAYRISLRALKATDLKESHKYVKSHPRRHPNGRVGLSESLRLGMHTWPSGETFM